MILKEGGNVFKDINGKALTQRINQTDVKPTLAWLEQMTDLDLQNNTLGSTGLKPTSGDLDVAVDASQITPDQLAAELTQWCTSQNLKPHEYIKKSGPNVHFRTPIAGNPDKGYVQTDFMFMKNLGIGKFFLTAPANSEYKGQDRNILVNSVAKALGWKLDQRRGIIDRATEQVVATDPDEIARLLLNKSASKDDLYSVETIVQALANDPKREEKLAQARDHFSKAGVPFFETRGESDVNFLARLRDRIVNKGMVAIMEDAANVGGKAKGIEHIEDLVFRKGSRGIREAIDILKHIAESTASTTTVKWDGKPAIVFGRKPTGEFVLTDVAGFTAKGYNGLATSVQQIQDIMSKRGGDRSDLVALYAKLFPLLEAAVPANHKGYFQGDLLYTSQPPEVSGAYVFKPNTIEYRIPASSDVGQRIGSSDVGIAMHTKYKDPESPKEPIGNFKFNPVDGLLLLEPVYAKDNIELKRGDLTQIKSILSQHGSHIDHLFNPAELRSMQITDLPRLCIDYINSLVSSSDVQNFSNILPGFGQWLQTKVTPRKYNNIVEYLQSPRSNMDGISAAFTAFVLLHDLKMNVLQQLDRQHPGQEGWVMNTPAGQAKLVNRFDFSRANRQNNPKA